MWELSPTGLDAWPVVEENLFVCRVGIIWAPHKKYDQNVKCLIFYLHVWGLTKVWKSFMLVHGFTVGSLMALVVFTQFWLWIRINTNSNHQAGPGMASIKRYGWGYQREWPRVRTGSPPQPAHRRNCTRPAGTGIGRAAAHLCCSSSGRERLRIAHTYLSVLLH